MEARLGWCLVLLSLCLGGVRSAPELLNEEVKRTVDLGTHLAKVSTELSLANPSSSTPASSFLLALDPGLESHLAYLSVQVRGTTKTSCYTTNLTEKVSQYAVMLCCNYCITIY
uniref:Dolichyl-diphosphooligosaccharide--protein glycosyltransferase subunit 1 n=1 Tax=Anolis carolinensis TaxID=28377 RepID=A0A803SMQ9_ANOCA